MWEVFLNAELAVYRRRTGSLHHGWDLELEGNVSHYACCCVCVPADYDEIILESRSSELLLRNFKSDISDWSTDAVSSQVLHVTWNYLVICCRSLDLYAQVVAFSWRLLLQVSILHQCRCSEFAPRVCGIDASIVLWSVSFMMTLAHVLRPALIPEPEKVDPLVSPWQ